VTHFSTRGKRVSRMQSIFFCYVPSKHDMSDDDI
jgi:hypothetical protein